MQRARASGGGGSNGVDVDNAARWFLAGIVVSLINTGLVLAFIGIPGITDRDGDTVRLEEADIRAIAAAVGGRPEVDGAAAVAGGRTLQFTEPVFVEIARPTFLSAHDGVAWVVSQGAFQLWRVDLEGESSEEDLDGIDDLGESAVMDVDVTTDGTLYLLVRDGRFDWRLFRRSGEEDGGWEIASSSDLTGWLADVVAVSVADTGAVYLSSSDPPGLFRMEPPLERVREWVSGPAVLGVDTVADDSLQLYAAPEIAPSDPMSQIGYVRAADGSAGAWRSTYSECTTASASGAAPAAVTATATVEATAGPTAAETPAPTAEATATGTAEPAGTATAVAETEPAQATAESGEETAADETEAESPADALVATQPAGAFGPRFPRDVAIVDATHALIVDSLNHVVRLQVVGGGGEVVFGVACEHGDDERHLLNPRGAAIDELGNVFIADTANGRVVLLAAATGSDVARAVSVPAPAAALAAETEEEAQPTSTPVATGAAFEVGVPEACPAQDPACAEGNRFEPRAVAVSAGETVTFNINAASHQVAVYGLGMRPADIDTTLVGGVPDTPGAGRTIIDPNGRIAESPDLPFAPDPATRWEWDTTGVAPGTYLVICTFQPHFEEGMYGWVIVE